MIIEPIAADLALDEVELALLHAAVGDYAAEVAVLLLANDGYWVARLRAAELITVEAEPVGGQLWARIECTDLDAALADGRLGPVSQEQLAVLRVAVSLADGPTGRPRRPGGGSGPPRTRPGARRAGARCRQPRPPRFRLDRPRPRRRRAAWTTDLLAAGH